MGTWDYYGKHDPYYGVLTYDQFRTGTLDAAAREKFFASGVEVVDSFIAAAEAAFGDVRKNVALDYGCGVGRLTRPLSERFQQVIGVDISSSMLDEARRNLADRQHVTFELAGAQSNRSVDFVLSKIVFQHIPPREATRILGQLAGRLTPGGVGILDLPVRYTSGKLRRVLSAVRTMLPSREPVIPLHIHDLRGIDEALRRAGCETRHQLSQTPMFEKAVVIFRRNRVT
jgi:SAM-dependent methyltransferase